MKGSKSPTRTGHRKADKTLERFHAAFEAMPVKARRQFVNAFTSDLTGSGWDYFRTAKPPGRALRKEPVDSITPERVTMSVRMRWNPIKGLTPERAVGYLDQWRLGFFRSAGMMWDQMQRRDYQLKITEPKRKKSVARHGYDVLILENLKPGQEALAQQQKEFLQNFYDNVSVTTALDPDESGGMSLLLRQMMDAQMKYYAVHEIVWQPMDDGNLTAKFIFCPVWWFEGTRGKLRFLESEFQIYGDDMLPGEWLVTCGDGLMEAITLIYIFKWMAMKSCLSLLDKFGQPGIHGKTDATKGSKEWEDFVLAVQEFAQEWGAVTNRNAEISLIEAKSTISGEGPFLPLVAMLDRAITQLLRGGDLGTSSGKNRQGASLQQDETEILETDDNKTLEETLGLKVSRFALTWKFGPDTPQLVYLKLRTTPRRDLQNDIAIDTFLVEAGAPIAINEALERYGRPVPKPGEPTLQPPAANTASSLTEQNRSGTPGESDNQFANSGAAISDKRVLVEAILSEFNGINQRLAAVLKIDDPEIQKEKLAAVLTDLERLEKNLDHDPAIANALYKILAANVGNGIADAAKERKGSLASMQNELPVAPAPAPVAALPPPPININVQIAPGEKRSTKILRDADGRISGTEEVTNGQ